MPDMAWGHYERDEPAQSPQDMLDTEDLRDVTWRLNAILQRDHTRLWPDQWTESLDCLTDLPGFHTQQDHIHVADLGGIIRRLHGMDGIIPVQTLYMQAAGLQRA
jgi:hypothetical protein